MAVYKTNKEIGEGMLECLNRVIKENNIPEIESVTFAGRLDPAASGEVVFLSGETIKDKDLYLHKDKIYEVEYIFGIKTDTGDLLGILQEFKNIINEKDLDIEKCLEKLSGKRNQRFHAFSSKVVEGKPLWLHARDGTTAYAEHEIDIYRLDLVNKDQISTHDIFNKVKNLTTIVNGDFRQREILESFSTLDKENINLPIIKISAHVTSGTYMRVLGEEIGEILGLPVCAYSINRIKIID